MIQYSSAKNVSAQLPTIQGACFPTSIALKPVVTGQLIRLTLVGLTVIQQ